ncbi:MAG: hypothetical protein AAF291_17080 [Pseudomonadota bacterium]
MTKRLLNAALVPAGALSLSGCVAAAIPLVAGGALAGTTVDGIDADTPRPQTASRDAAPDQTNVVEVAPAADAPGPDPGRASAARAQLLKLSQGPARVADLDTARANNAPLVAAAAPPALGAPPPPAMPASPAPSALAPLVRYAKARAASNAEPSLSSATRPLSARLKNPAALDGVRARCEAREPAVLIDLDKAGEGFSPEATFAASLAAAQDLAALRKADIAIAWISGASAAYAGDVRAKLRSSGLDPEGEDQILLMRYPGDRKQTRREELANATCLLAIAGDERADFDELFEYLSRPEAAQGLDLLIGDGWFLLPGFPQTDFQATDIVSKDTPTP